MTKVFDASCAAGVVTVDEIAVEATILSQGVESSEGVFVIDGLDAWYLTSNATDLKTTIEKLISTISKVNDALSTIASTLTAIGTGMTGSTTAPPATLATSVAQINSDVTTLTGYSTQLSTLKDTLK